MVFRTGRECAASPVWTPHASRAAWGMAATRVETLSNLNSARKLALVLTNNTLTHTHPTSSLALPTLRPTEEADGVGPAVPGSTHPHCDLTRLDNPLPPYLFLPMSTAMNSDPRRITEALDIRATSGLKPGIEADNNLALWAVAVGLSSVAESDSLSCSTVNSHTHTQTNAHTPPFQTSPFVSAHR